MPNGGVPINMVLRPKHGEVVIYCHAGDLRVFAREAWEKEGSDARPIFSLTRAEAGALAWQLEHWLDGTHFRPGYNMPDGSIDADYAL